MSDAKLVYPTDGLGGMYGTGRVNLGKFTDRGPRGQGFSNFADPYRVGVTSRVSTGFLGYCFMLVNNTTPIGAGIQ